eukprot:8242013-Pyramimonas_sp.AAC.1
MTATMQQHDAHNTRLCVSMRLDVSQVVPDRLPILRLVYYHNVTTITPALGFDALLVDVQLKMEHSETFTMSYEVSKRCSSTRHSPL